MSWVLDRVRVLRAIGSKDDVNAVVKSKLVQPVKENSTMKLYKNLSVTSKIKGIYKALNENRLVYIVYRNEYEKDGKKVVEVTKRAVKVSHTWIYANGTAYMKGYCYLKKQPRTFRLDKIVEMGIADQKLEPKGIVMYPATWDLRKAMARTVKNVQVWLDNGWSQTPVIITEPTKA